MSLHVLLSLMFASELDLMMETGCHYSVHRTCHQILHVKSNLKDHYLLLSDSET